MPRLDLRLIPAGQRLFRGALTALILTLPLSALAAQDGAATTVGGLRAYWHVFIAYAVVIVLVLGWVISIGRRLKDVEQRLGE
jgi:CcmD family protein